MKPIGLFELMDRMYAELFNVSVEEFVDTIEKLSENRMELLLSAIESGDDNKIEKARRIFKQIK